MSTTYGSIDLTNNNEQTNSTDIIKPTKGWLLQSHIYSCVFIYISYLRDLETFNFMIRVFTQLILYNIPDQDEQQRNNLMLDSPEEIALQQSRIKMLLIIVVPYTVMNFVFAIVLHLRWFINSINSIGSINSIASMANIGSLINSITETTLNTTVYIHEGVFVDLVGESSMNCRTHSPVNSLYLVVLDVAIVVLQSSLVVVLAQRQRGRQRADGRQ